ncbi:MAG: DUF2520 domain-containing protein [Hymenobacteraceae bacterium]|nr:DUF2520 domain-containing protein [Hymenobacteraceae bacterium]
MSHIHPAVAPPLPPGNSPSARALTLVVLGAGHVATHLVPALVAAGHRVAGIWSRDVAHAEALRARVPGAVVLVMPAEAAALAPDLVLIAVPDHAVAATVAAAQLPATIAVAHTAGTLPLPAHPRAGVLYPLQTFSTGRAVDMRAVPFFLEATDPETAALLERVARNLSREPPRWLTATERAPLHLAAVFAANFPNHLLGVSARALAGTSVPFEVLRPLVTEVIAKAFAAPDGPFSVQTGPARRADAPTLAAHRARLAADPSLAPWLPVYESLTTAIQRIAVTATPPPTVVDSASSAEGAG